MTCNPCQRGAPAILPGNRDAWEVWNRVNGQVIITPTFGGPPVLRFPADVVWAAIAILTPDDPLDTFDKVMTIATTTIDALEKDRDSG